MPNVKFNFREDFEKKVELGLSPAQLQLLKELFQKHHVCEDELYYIMHKKPEAIKFYRTTCFVSWLHAFKT